MFLYEVCNFLQKPIFSSSLNKLLDQIRDDRPVYTAQRCLRGCCPPVPLTHSLRVALEEKAQYFLTSSPLHCYFCAQVFCYMCSKHFASSRSPPLEGQGWQVINPNLTFALGTDVGNSPPGKAGGKTPEQQISFLP